MKPPDPPSRGEQYDSNYERRAAAGENVHGEADFVSRWNPRAVFDAGCGTGRIGRELARRGVHVVGADLDAEMLETARRKAPGVSWIRHDISTIDLGEEFDVVLLAGNVINFVEASSRGPVIANLARHIGSGGLLIDGHSLGPAAVPVADLDAWAAASALRLVERWATWDRDVFEATSPYAVSVFRKPPVP